MESLQLTIRSLSKRYHDGTRALDQVSLTVPRGMFGLLGPNGAGKSTLMRIVAGLQEPDTGDVRLGPVDVLRDPETVRRSLGYLPQEFGFYPSATALDLLDHFAVLKGVRQRAERKALVEALLRRTNLWQVRHKRLGGFSGGMRQRFGIAVALIGEPRLIIVDEPTAGLDPEERVRFLNLLAELGEQAVVILSTHIVDDVAELCSQMAVINRGRIQFEGDPLGAIADLRGHVWRRFVTADELARLEQDQRVLATKMVAGRLAVRIKASVSPSAGFDVVEPTLEDVYFDALRADRPADAVSTAA